MASSIPSGLLVSALFLLFFASTPAANGQRIWLALGAEICCAPFGSCSGGAPPAVDANLTLTCSSSILAGPINATTGADGSFFINASTLPGVTLSQVLGTMVNPCTLQVQPNQTTCPELIPNGSQNKVFILEFLRAVFKESP